ncbi:hypothetical protein BKA65DRAFT_45950 [Rhexocercosporidium sp. MPI-PUGE-AT-0058]|nr:hypothetical protein BKA65DRAFT_45950 [Rhexocercosporidium sp. MPI-PUGE-AT-0058]
MMSEIHNTSDFIETDVFYLVKDLKHDKEKPYELAYDVGGLIPQTNMSYQPHRVSIYNFRELQKSDSFSEYGFKVAKLGCTLTATDFNDDTIVKDRYYPAVETLLLETFPHAAAVRIIEHGLRKRSTNFPKGEAASKDVQPATKVHADYSINSADRTARAFFKDVSEGYQRLVTVNFWKSFQGPGNDWPLALCDHRTIDHRSESISADVVFDNRFTENQRFYHSPAHRWYYFKDLGGDEVVMFRQTDSDLEQGGGVAHTSFHNPHASADAAPRASIELRAFVFFS